MKLSKKTIRIGLAVSLTLCMIVTIVFIGLQKPDTPTGILKNEESKLDLDLNIPNNSLDEPSITASDNKTNSPITIDVNGKTETSTSSDDKKPSVSNGNVSQGTKTPPNDTSPTVKDNPNSKTPSKDNSGGVVKVTPVERSDEPAGPSGIKPKDTDWVSVNPEIPSELYHYDYTVVNQEEILTGKQLEHRGFRDWEKAAEAARGALSTYYTVDYRNIGSTNPNDKADYLRSLVYWVGESAQYDICSYMQSVKDNKIISTASVVTDGSLIYNNGVRLIRARVYVTFESGASFYGLQNGIKYYKDVEVAVYASTGEDRYGYGKSADFQALLFSDNCFNTLCDFKKA